MIKENQTADLPEDYWSLMISITKTLPNEQSEVLPGIPWGDCCQLFTPAFWKLQYAVYTSGGTIHNDHKLGKNIIEEVIACLLGGYGIPAEIGLMAFDRLKTEGLIHPGVNHSLIFKALSTPFISENNKSTTYRFYNQKSKFISEFLNRDDLNSISINNDIQLREWLLTVNGIGLKTASWITRNWLSSDNVAILDIHLLRAGKLTGFFEDISNVNRDYFSLEAKYLSFCKALDVAAANLDALIWDYMKKNNRFALKALDSIN
jgi:N-glycosylase/DNA lyase